jgi:hypothetical protein
MFSLDSSFRGFSPCLIGSFALIERAQHDMGLQMSKAAQLNGQDM